MAAAAAQEDVAAKRQARQAAKAKADAAHAAACLTRHGMSRIGNLMDVSTHAILSTP